MINLNYRDQRPIYEQIKEGIRNLVITGAMESGEKLPSVRELASSLAINPNTIQRAYRELEAEGYIYSIPGKGSFADVGEHIKSKRREELLRIFDNTVDELKVLGVSDEELKDRLTSEVKSK